MADLCTKFEVSSVSRYAEITLGVKFENGSTDPDHAAFRKDVSSAGWDNVPNLKSVGSPVAKL